MAYGGYSGNVLFSRVPLLNATTYPLPVAPQAFNIDALYARVNLDGLDDVHLYVHRPLLQHIHQMMMMMKKMMMRGLICAPHLCSFCTQFMPIGPDQSPAVMASLEQLNLGQVRNMRHRRHPVGACLGPHDQRRALWSHLHSCVAVCCRRAY